MRRIRNGSASPSGHSSAPGSSRSGQSVSTSMRTPPFRPLTLRTRAIASRRLLGVGDDLELDVAPVPRGHHAQQAADGIGEIGRASCRERGEGGGGGGAGKRKNTAAGGGIQIHKL